MRNRLSRALRDSRAGLTLLEIVVVVIILMTLAGLIIPTVRDLLISSKVNRILETVDAARQACLRYYQDTDQYAVEDSGPPGDPPAVAPLRLLSAAPPAASPVPGWKGIYLRRPLTTADNPAGERVVILNNLDSTPYLGFDLLGESAGPTAKGPGNMIVFENLSEEIAGALDKKIDPPVDGKPAETWGRCVYQPNGGTCHAYIYLLGNMP